MKFHPSELHLLYHSENATHRQALAHAKGLSDHINVRNLNSQPYTTTIWRDILNMLHLTAKDLLNRADPLYQKSIAGGNYNEEDWLNILTHNTQLIKAPIAIKNGTAILCLSPTDIYKLEREPEALAID